MGIYQLPPLRLQMSFSARSVLGHGYCWNCFWVGFCSGPALGGFASSWDWSDGSSAVFDLTPFSLAAVISFGLA